MKKLLDYADRYIENSTWKDMAMLKFCLFSLGILAGMQIPKKDKKEAGILAFVVFVLTYIPLMKKLVDMIR
ncbi:permease of phosphate ABC transporter [bacterium 1XD8-76]|nr:permease of phosphate ABC transporter [bacterium 1XD8-76]